MRGRVIFVGAGAGAADLLTLRAVRCLERADVVLHDDLVAGDVLQFVSPKAVVRSVGKRCGRRGVSQQVINALMVEHALRGKTVVRLKSGDPSIFGRLGEEIDALQEAGVEFEIVPGVSAALAAAAAARVSLTDRRVASRVVFAAASRAGGKRQDWANIFAPGTTVVIYMPANLGVLAAELDAAGIAGRTSCTVVSNAGAIDQTTHIGRISDLPLLPRAHTPAVVIVGDVVRLNERTQSREPTNMSISLA